MGNNVVHFDRSGARSFNYMSIESLTVKLTNGETFYFSAGPIVGDPSNRVENLRFAIENDTVFRSVDESGVAREFAGHEVANYHLA